ncbi:MAG: AAA family ATPase [Egibacteraceae bacterium]
MAGAQDNEFNRRAAIMAAFSPSTPINDKDLFRGRHEQLFKVFDVIHGRGQHGAVYGERGVGKTSVAAVASAIADVQGLLTARVNCDGQDSFSSLWKKVVDELDIYVSHPEFTGRAGQHGEDELETAFDQASGLFLQPDVSPGDVKIGLQLLSAVQPVVICFDEFDRVRDDRLKTALADLLKALSDHAVLATVLVVGVADTVEDLIHEHESVNRALVQVRIPRMSDEELGEIVDRGLEAAGMDIAEGARRRIVRLSQGLPHYTHLLGQISALRALGHQAAQVEPQDVDDAVDEAIHNTLQSVVSLYHRATSSPQKNIYAQVLLGCALARTDERGYFAPADVRQPLSELAGKRYDIPAFARHLTAFATDRGPVLQKSGRPQRFRYRFRDPLLRPYVLMRGVRDGLAPMELLERVQVADS